MTTLRFEISMSLDGYVTAANPRLDAPMGDGGQVLHEWAFGDDELSRDVHDDSQDTVGVSIAGRRTYDTSIADWGADGPGSDRRTPTVIVTHSTPDNVPGNSVYTFVDNVEEAAALAERLADGKDIDVFSASVGTQLLRAGLVDEIRIHLVPVLLGARTRLLEDAGRARAARAAGHGPRVQGNPSALPRVQERLRRTKSTPTPLRKPHTGVQDSTAHRLLVHWCRHQASAHPTGGRGRAVDIERARKRASADRASRSRRRQLPITEGSSVPPPDPRRGARRWQRSSSCTRVPTVSIGGG
jgi:dihydrofolate reductase